jgi:hypothetical protein
MSTFKPRSGKSAWVPEEFADVPREPLQIGVGALRLSDSSPVMHTEIRLGSDQYTRRPLASPLDRCDHGSFSGHLFERDPWLAFGR